MGKIIRFIVPRLSYWTASLLLLACVSVGFAIVDSQNKRFDLTRDKIFTLSPNASEILRDIKEPVTAKAFFKEAQPGKEELEDLLKIFKDASPFFDYQFVDPDRNPGQAKLYGIDEYGAIVLVQGSQHVRFKDVTEEAIVNALLKLSSETRKKVYFTSGHNEKELDAAGQEGYSLLKERLISENYQVGELVLSRDNIPADAALIAVAGPTTDFLPEETRVLKKYLDDGGRVLLMLDPVEERLSNFETWLRSYGVVIGQDVVIDKLSRVFGADYLIPVITSYGKHKITENFNMASFLPFSRSVIPRKELPDGVRVTPLALTSQGSWAEQTWKEIEKGEATFDDKDFAGPLSIGVVLEKDNSEMRLIVFGDADFADNAHFRLAGNRDLFLNSLAWLAGEEKSILIRSRERAQSPLLLTAEQQKLIFAVPVIALPLFTLGSGAGMMLYRKRFN